MGCARSPTVRCTVPEGLEPHEKRKAPVPRPVVTSCFGSPIPPLRSGRIASEQGFSKGSKKKCFSQVLLKDGDQLLKDTYQYPTSQVTSHHKRPVRGSWYEHCMPIFGPVTLFAPVFACSTKRSSELFGLKQEANRGVWACAQLFASEPTKNLSH